MSMWKDYEKNLADLKFSGEREFLKDNFNLSDFGQIFQELSSDEQNFLIARNDMMLEQSYTIEDADYYETTGEKRDQYLELAKSLDPERLAVLESQFNDFVGYNKDMDSHDFYAILGSYEEETPRLQKGDYVLDTIDGKEAVVKVDAVIDGKLADATAYHEDFGFVQSALDPTKEYPEASRDQVQEFDQKFNGMVYQINEEISLEDEEIDRLKNGGEIPGDDVSDDRLYDYIQEVQEREDTEELESEQENYEKNQDSKEPEHSMKGQNEHWVNVIKNIEDTQRQEKAEQQRDNHVMYGINDHWNAVIESVALSDNEVTKFPANALPNQEPKANEELVTLQNLLGDAVRRAEIILNAKHNEVTKVLTELTSEELDKYKNSDLTADQLLTITNEFQNKITEAISMYAVDKANKLSWTDRLDNFKDKVKDAVKNLKENVQNRLQSIKNIPENSKNFAKSQLLRAVVSLNNTLQNELGKVEEKLQSPQQTEPMKPAAEAITKDAEAVKSVEEAKIEPKLSDRDRITQMIDMYKEEYGQHLLKNFNQPELNPNYDMMRKFDESLKTQPDLIAQLRIESISDLREKELPNLAEKGPDKVNLDNYLTDKADGLAHSLKFMESTQQRVFLFKDLENTPYVVKSSKEIREELMQQLQKEQASEKELENLASGAGKTSDAKDKFKESNENKLRLMERIEEINGGEKILSDREQKYSLYAAYHNLVQENPQITPEERKTAVNNSPEEWKAADLKNGTSYYKDVYFEHDLKDMGKSPAEHTFEQVYDELGIGKEESQQMETGHDEMEMG